MKKACHFVLGLTLSVVSVAAVACSCRSREVAEELDEATDVVVARVAFTTQEPATGDTSGRYIVEHASFDVIEVIKGSKKVADKIQIRSEIGPGPCGRSARNSPVWLEVVPSEPSEDNPPKPATISDTWLIYGYGKEPYELSHCSRSRPIERVNEKELSTLRRYVKKSEKEHRP